MQMFYEVVTFLLTSPTAWFAVDQMLLLLDSNEWLQDFVADVQTKRLEFSSELEVGLLIGAVCHETQQCSSLADSNRAALLEHQLARFAATFGSMSLCARWSPIHFTQWLKIMQRMLRAALSTAVSVTTQVQRRDRQFAVIANALSLVCCEIQVSFQLLPLLYPKLTQSPLLLFEMPLETNDTSWLVALVYAFILARTLAVVSSPSIIWPSLRSPALFGGRQLDFIILLSGIVGSTICMVCANSAEGSWFSMSWFAVPFHIIAVLLLYVLTVSFAFGGRSACDVVWKKRALCKVDKLWTSFVGRGSTHSAQATHAEERRASVMQAADMARFVAALPGACEMMTACCLVSVVVCAKISTLQAVVHTAAMLVVFPLPSILPYASGTHHSLQQCMDALSILRSSGLLPPRQPRWIWAAIAGRRSLRKTFVEFASALFRNLVMLLPVTLGEFGRFASAVLEAQRFQDLNPLLSSSSDPRLAHLFPVERALECLASTVTKHATRGVVQHNSDRRAFAHPIQLMTVVSLERCLTQASHNTLLKVRLLTDPNFVAIYDQLLDTLTLWLDHNVVLAPGGRAYCLRVDDFVDPVRGVSPSMTALHLHLQCAVNFFVLCLSALGDTVCGDPEVLDVFPIALLKVALLRMIRRLPAMLRICVWREGQGGSFAARAIGAEVTGQRSVRVDRAVESPSMETECDDLCALRGVLCELSVRLLHCAALPELSLDASVVDVESRDGATAQTPPLLPVQQWMTVPRAHEYFVHVAYALHKRYFRSNFPVVVVGQFACLLAALWSKYLVNEPAGSPFDLRTTVFQEDRKAHSVYVRVPNFDGSEEKDFSDARIPLVLQTCDQRPVLFYCALVALKGVSEVSQLLALQIASVARHFWSAAYHLGGLVELLAVHNIEYLQEALVPATARSLQQQLQELSTLHSRAMEKLHVSLRAEGNTDDMLELTIVEKLLKSCGAASYLGLRTVAQLTVTLKAYCDACPRDLQRQALSGLSDYLPLRKHLTKPIVNALLHRAAEVAKGCLESDVEFRGTSVAFQHQLIETVSWTSSMVELSRLRAPLATRRFSQDISASQKASRDLWRTMISFFEFPSSTVLLSPSDAACCDEDCAICLEHLSNTFPHQVASAARSHGDGESNELKDAPDLEEDEDGEESLRSCPEFWRSVAEVRGVCRHKFHGKCLFLWLTSSDEHTKCPVCRRAYA